MPLWRGVAQEREKHFLSCIISIHQFRTRLQTIGSQIVGLGALYDVSPDGQRFLMNGPPADPGPPMTVVLNWTAGLNGRH